MIALTARPKLGVYVHWPFCAAICPYCDFNVYPAHAADDNDWAAAYKRELTHAHSYRSDGPVETVFFGGGTPSLMPPALVGGLLDEINRLWGLTANAEITLEANPTSAPHDTLAELRAAGVTRLSMGVQALDDAALKFLGRTHNAAEAVAAFEAARDLFPAASLDLIYARPDQTIKEWQGELKRALALEPSHLSAYQLTLEPGTAFFKRHAKGLFTMPDEALAADIYWATDAMCAAAGLSAYEISNHARAGAACRHNVNSWQGGDYLGIGPGAHGRITMTSARLATIGFRSPNDWAQAVARDGHGWQEITPLSPHEQISERLLLGLRLTAGMGLLEMQDLGFAPPRSPIVQKLDDLRTQGLLQADRTRLAATPAGRLVLDTLVAELLAD